MSVSASKLVVNNTNVCVNKAHLTVNPTGHNYWATMYLLQIFSVLGYSDRFSVTSKFVKEFCNSEEEKYCRQ
jgi:hypothetical protein